MVYDVGSERVVACVAGHDNDVNAVEYIDNPNIIATGSDDTLIKAGRAEGN